MKLGALTDLELKFHEKRLAGLSDATGSAVTATFDADLLRDHEAQALEAIRLCHGAPGVKALVVTNSPPITVKGQQYVATARRWVCWSTRRGLKILRTAVRRKVLVERK